MEKLIGIVNKLFAKLYIPCGIAADKQAHFLSGAIIATLCPSFFGVYSIVVVTMIASAKELYDALNKKLHTPDIWDLIVTVLGGVFGYILILSI